MRRLSLVIIFLLALAASAGAQTSNVVCGKYTVSSTNPAFTASATSVSVTLFTLPPRSKIIGVDIKHSVAWAGAGVTSTTASLGDGTSHTAYSAAHDIFAAVSNTAFTDTAQFKSTTMAGSSVVARFTANVNFGATAGTSISAATNASPVVLTSTGHGLNTGASVTISGATGSWTPINGTSTITKIDANSFSIPVDSTAFGALTGTVVFSGKALTAGSVDFRVCRVFLP